MTREEAIHILDNLKPTNTKSSFDAYVVGKAITMAIKVKNNGGQLPVIIEEGKEVPQNLCKVTIEPDKALIREYLKDHPDCEFARIGERGRHIEVK